MHGLGIHALLGSSNNPCDNYNAEQQLAESSPVCKSGGHRGARCHRPCSFRIINMQQAVVAAVHPSARSPAAQGSPWRRKSECYEANSVSSSCDYLGRRFNTCDSTKQALPRDRRQRAATCLPPLRCQAAKPWHARGRGTRFLLSMPWHYGIVHCRRPNYCCQQAHICTAGSCQRCRRCACRGRRCAK